MVCSGCGLCPNPKLKRSGRTSQGTLTLCFLGIVIWVLLQRSRDSSVLVLPGGEDGGSVWFDLSEALSGNTRSWVVVQS